MWNYKYICNTLSLLSIYNSAEIYICNINLIISHNRMVYCTLFEKNIYSTSLFILTIFITNMKRYKDNTCIEY